MISWSQIELYHKNPPYNILGRSEFMQKKYKKYKEYLKNNNRNIYDEIMYNYIKNNKYAITYNNFPYNLERGIYHLLMWVNPNYKMDYDEVEDILRSNGVYEYIIFRNYENNCSVCEIVHYHIFIRNKDYVKFLI